jgi:hypothetical protein
LTGMRGARDHSVRLTTFVEDATVSTISFDPRTLIVSRNWLPRPVGYHGDGRAEFLNPSEVAEGRVTVLVEESGRVLAEMDVAWLSSGQSVVEWAADLQARGDRICERQVVRCEDGEYSAIGAIGTTMWIVGCPNANAQLRFFPAQSEFVSLRRGEAAYWILPLLNFLADFVPSPTTLNRRPLRLRQVQTIPSGLSSEDVAKAQLYGRGAAQGPLRSP